MLPPVCRRAPNRPRNRCAMRGPAAQPLSLLVGGDVTLGHHYEEYFDEQAARAARSRRCSSTASRNVKEAATRRISSS